MNIIVTSKLEILQKCCNKKMRRFGFCLVGERKKTSKIIFYNILLFSLVQNMVSKNK
jgi:hypothetical protein